MPRSSLLKLYMAKGALQCCGEVQGGACVVLQLHRGWGIPFCGWLSCKKETSRNHETAPLCCKGMQIITQQREMQLLVKPPYQARSIGTAATEWVTSPRSGRVTLSGKWPTQGSTNSIAWPWPFSSDTHILAPTVTAGAGDQDPFETQASLYCPSNPGKGLWLLML